MNLRWDLVPKLTMLTKQQLEGIASRVLPDLPADSALAQVNLFLARVMSAGSLDEIRNTKAHFGESAFRAVLRTPPLQTFDRPSWNMWHNFFHLSVPEMPESFFAVYPWFKNRAKPKGPVTAEMIDHMPNWNSPVYAYDERPEA
jgi:hypothetical protein